MALELMVRYEQPPDLESLKARVETCLRRQLRISELPSFAYMPGLTGEHAHEINVFLASSEDTRTWLLMGPSERLAEDQSSAETWATVAAMRTPKSLLLTLVTAATLADLVGEPITDDAMLLKAGRLVSPPWLLEHLSPRCRGRSFEQAAEAVSEALGLVHIPLETDPEGHS